MAVDFKTSRTKDNLMRAFAGESQARNRYTFAAGQAKQMKLHVLERAFLFTADQEKEHAEIFYKHLQEMAGETITVDGGYPVDISPDVGQLLRMAQHNEYEEHDDVYKNFGQIAKEEGFSKVAASFHSIAQIEKVHGDRFGTLAQLYEDGMLFKCGQETYWMCLNCGYICNVKEAPAHCPVCDHDQGYFVRLCMAPFGDTRIQEEG